MWTKLFADGKTISEPASWSRTNLENMIGCTLVHNTCRISIFGAGQYWQSDTYLNNMEWGISGSRLIKRRISIYLPDISVGQITENSKDTFRINFDVKVDNRTNPPGLILINQVPSWLVVEIDILRSEITHYLSEDRI